MIPFVETKYGLSVFIDGEMQEIPKEHREFLAIKTLVESNDPFAALRIKDILTRVITSVKDAIAAAPNGRVTLEHGAVRYNGEVIHNSLTDRMLRMIDEGFSVTPLVNFLEKLMQNPTPRVVEHLYDFLQKGSIPISEDGDFVAYKAIREDWKDIHSGTFDNSIGKVVEIPRSAVDDNPDVTCSRGLHVCSFNYLPNFADANGHVVLCKVNPADVVAIPRDYNDTKMRCCKYTVIGEHTDYYKARRDILAERSVYAPDGDDDFDDDDDLDDDDWENT